MISAVGFVLSSSPSLSVSSLTIASFSLSPLSAASISMSSPSCRLAPFVKVPFGWFFCLRDLTTRSPMTVSLSRWCSNRLRSRGLSPVRSRTRTYDVSAVESTSLDESGAKRRAMAPVLVFPDAFGILEWMRAGKSFTRFMATWSLS